MNEELELRVLKLAEAQLELDKQALEEYRQEVRAMVKREQRKQWELVSYLTDTQRERYETFLKGGTYEYRCRG